MTVSLPLTVLCHPRCSTCAKALAWLDNKEISYTWRSILDHNPTTDELSAWIEQSSLPYRRFFNTSGNAYRNNGVKNLLDAWEHTDNDGGLAHAIELLSTDGMLCKRPIVIDAAGNFVCIGFKPKDWDEKLC